MKKDNSMTMENNSSKRLKEIRFSLSLTQKEFAEKLNIKQGTYSDIERGKIGVSTKVASQLREKYQVNIDWLYNGTGLMFLDETDNIILDAELINDLEVILRRYADYLILDKGLSDEGCRIRMKELHKVRTKLLKIVGQ